MAVEPSDREPISRLTPVRNSDRLHAPAPTSEPPLNFVPAMFPCFVAVLLSAIAVGVLSQPPQPAVRVCDAPRRLATRPQADGLIHEAGRCSIKYQCGASQAPGGGFYDCVNNSLAEPVDNTTARSATSQAQRFTRVA